MAASVTESATLTVPAKVAKKTSENLMPAHVSNKKSCGVQGKEAVDGLRKRALTHSQMETRTRDRKDRKEGGST